jgi:hypothetical protein
MSTQRIGNVAAELADLLNDDPKTIPLMDSVQIVTPFGYRACMIAPNRL